MTPLPEMTGFNWTKIIATLGPATETEETLRGLVESGLDVVRLNMSHGDHDWHARTLERVRKVGADLSRHIGVLMDLQGPRIRVGQLQGGKVELPDGAVCTITCEEIVGTAERFSTTYDRLAQDVDPGDRILLDDGLLELRVVEATGCLIRCEVVHGGTLSEHKGMNLPGVKVSAPAVSEKDAADLAFGLAHGVDMIALSFVRTAEDVEHLRASVQAAGKDTPIVSKLEKPEAIEHLGKIVSTSDAVMVARGDLAVETSPEEVPLLQKSIIASCAAARKPVIIATQMLDSMRENPTPTRAEASDVANAILDGADCVMLSGETAIGKYPLESVRMMRRIATAAEGALFRGRHLLTEWVGGRERSLGEAISAGAAEIAEQIGARVVIAFTQSGSTARLASKCRPSVPIIAATPLVETARRCSLYWGVVPIVVDQSTSTDEQIALIDRHLRELGLLQRGDKVVITAGTPIGERGSTNMMKLHVIGGASP
jgi:pyruvate kinase